MNGGDQSSSGFNTTSTLSLNDDNDLGLSNTIGAKQNTATVHNAGKLLLVDECQREIIKLYKIAALIEIVFFVAFMGVYLSHTIEESRVYNFWQIGTTLKNLLVNRPKAQEILRDHKSLNAKPLVKSLLKNAFNLSLLLDKNKDFIAKNSIVCNSVRLKYQKVHESDCKSTNFDAIFPRDADMLPCVPPYSPSTEFISPIPSKLSA